jgi:hypothetical protein
LDSKQEKELARVQRFQPLDLSVPLAKGSVVLVLVLLYFIQNLCHSLNLFFLMV